MPAEPLSPELVLVDPDLAARARAALPDRPTSAARPHPAAVAPAAPPAPRRAAAPATRYPLWARLTASLWILVVGILIGGAAIPHAQDRPHVVPPEEDVTICERPTQPETPNGPPGRPFGAP